MWWKKNKPEIKIISLPQESSAPAPSAISTNHLEKRIALEEALNVIEKLNESITSSLTINELSNKIVTTTCAILNVEICALLLLDEQTGMLNVSAASGLDEKTAKSIHIKKGEEISGLTVKFNEIKVINDFEKEILLYNLKYDTCYKYSLVSLPLSFKKKAIGVLNLSNKKSDKPFSPTDIEILKIIALEAAMSLENAKLFEAQHKDYLNTIIALANAIDAKDPYTYHHSNNVTKYSCAIAGEMNLGLKEIEDIKYAGLLHDIGKIGIRDEVLLKTEKLTDAEYTEIKTHPVKAEEIVKSLPFLKQITKIIRHHHERWDGKGYPDGLKNNEIELGARILAIADSFDAMTTKRVYRDPLSLETAKYELIKNKGTQFDPYLVDCFIKVLEKEPTLFIST